MSGNTGLQFLLNVVIQFSQNHLSKRPFFPSLSRSSWLYVKRFIFELLILFHWAMCLVFFFPQYHTALITISLWYTFDPWTEGVRTACIYLHMIFFNKYIYSPVNLFSLMILTFFFSFIVGTQYIIHKAYKICAVYIIGRIIVNSRLLLVKYWGSQELLTPALLKGLV